VRDAVLPNNNDGWWDHGPAEDHDDHLLVADQNGTVVAYLLGEFVGTNDFAVIMEVAVVPKWQGRGAGVALTHAFAEIAVRRGCPVIYVRPLRDPERYERLVAYYARLGFQSEVEDPEDMEGDSRTVEAMSRAVLGGQP